MDRLGKGLPLKVLVLEPKAPFPYQGLMGSPRRVTYSLSIGDFQGKGLGRSNRGPRAPGSGICLPDFG